LVQIWSMRRTRLHSDYRTKLQNLAEKAHLHSATRAHTLREYDSIPVDGSISALRDVGALSDLDDISVGIADVAANLAVLSDRLCDELRTSTFP
jgi:hypothetical protein